MQVPIFFLLGLAASVLTAMSVGAIDIPVLSILGNTLDQVQETVLTQIRLPRVMLAGIVGAGLAVSGAAMQGLFRNPLADPGLIGVSSGAALAVGILIVLGGKYAGMLGLYGMSVAAFLGGLAVSLMIFRIAATSGTFSVTYLLLAGIAINALSGAATGVLTYLSTDQQLRTFTFWTMGSLGGALWPAVFVAGSIILPTIYVLMRNAHSLNVLMLGEDEAKHLGIKTKDLKRVIVICAALCVGVSVAVSGMIGFIGLLVPHLIRLMVSSDHRLLIPLAAIFGAILLILADTLARVVVAPSEMPVGVLTSLIGGPFFLWLLMRQFSNRFGI
ncbi:MAG: iron ABC transporter permease [Methylocystaceae bacterium]|nr:iron ABC transporter permease [Methylocystaceae bacterium]